MRRLILMSEVPLYPCVDNVKWGVYISLGGACGLHAEVRLFISGLAD